MNPIPALAVAALVSAGAPSEARIESSDGSFFAQVCMGLQNDSDLLRAELATADALRAFQIAIELVNIGHTWDDWCADDYGSITRAADLGVPTYEDSDADGVFDEDELAFGLDPRAADSDGDGLGDGVDPSWWGGLGGALPDVALLAEADARSGDVLAARDRLVDAQVALGGCGPDPRTGVLSDVCLGAQVLATHLDGAAR